MQHHNMFSEQVSVAAVVKRRENTCEKLAGGEEALSKWTSSSSSRPAPLLHPEMFCVLSVSRFVLMNLNPEPEGNPVEEAG